MRWKIIVVGKPALAYAKLGVEEYLKRLRRYAQVELVQLKAGPIEKVTQAMLDASAGSYRIVLDEKGKGLTTLAFADWVGKREMDGGTKAVSVLIGGSDGHSPDLRKQADLLLHLSTFTLQHELALLVFLEQLYRVQAHRAGSPYHREG